MTVEELIAKLSKIDPSFTVMYDNDNGLMTVDHIDINEGEGIVELY